MISEDPGPRTLLRKSGRLGSHMSLVRVALTQVEFRLLKDWDTEARYRVDTTPELAWERGDDDWIGYQFDFSWQVGEKDADEPLFTGLAQYQLVYEHPEDFAFEDDEAEAFGQTSVQLTVHPFVRELVQSLTTRAGLPPLTIPTIRQPLAPGDTDTDAC